MTMLGLRLCMYEGGMWDRCDLSFVWHGTAELHAWTIGRHAYNVCLRDGVATVARFVARC